MNQLLTKIKTFALIAPMLFILIGCGATNVERKTTGGVGLGALAGGVMSGSVGGAVAGAAVGGLAGYAIGTDQDRYADKKVLEQEKLDLEKEQTAIAKATITSDPKTAYRPSSGNALVGTTWRVISITGEQPFPDYHSVVSTFQTNSKVTTLVIGKEGETQSITETYLLVDDVLVISGEENGSKYVVDGTLSTESDTFVYVTPTYRVTGEKVK
jgi:osmotically inducible lipoprotein OsmB